MHKEINHEEGNVGYTLYYQKRHDDVVAIASSKSLLKLLKICLCTFGRNESAYIVDAHGDRCTCNALDFSDYHLYYKFREAVKAGKYYKMYDYRQRVRGLII